MKSGFIDVKDKALAFAAQFGFITQSIFFEYLCPLQKTQKYKFWRQLTDENLIMQARSFEDVYYLTKHGRKASPRSPVPARSIYFIKHDVIVAKIFLELMQSGLVLKSWTEYHLSSRPWDTYSILGADRIRKIPDLVVEMKSLSGTLRIAIEVERSRKTDSRYDQIALNYWGLKNIQLVLFCCENQATENAIQNAFNASHFQQAGKQPGTFLISRFEEFGLLAEARFANRKIPLKKLILTALNQQENLWLNEGAPSRKSFRAESESRKLVA